MSILSLPHAVSTTAGFPVYFMRSASNDVTLMRYEPTLPDETFRWAEPDEVKGACMALDADHVADLLFASGDDPAGLDDEAAIRIVDQVLTTTHCNAAECDEYSSVLWEDNPAAACLRMSACILRAARLLGTEA